MEATASRFATLLNLNDENEDDGACALDSGQQATTVSIDRPTSERTGRSHGPVGDGPPVPLSRAMIWIDLEMTGLDPDKDTILEIACCVTSGDLRRVMEGPEIAIHHSEEVLNSMNDWSMEAHKASGLTERCRHSMRSMATAEAETLTFVARHCVPGRAPLAGNAVHVDRAYLRRHMPRLHDFLHFRIIDVSSLNEIAKRWLPGRLALMADKQRNHRAMSDLRESIAELRFYKHHLFSVPDKGAPRVVEYRPGALLAPGAAHADVPHPHAQRPPRGSPVEGEAAEPVP